MMKKGTFSLHAVTLRAMGRRKLGSLLLVLIVILGVLVSAVLYHLTIRQETALDRMVRETEIRCIVTDAQGMNSDRLMMLSIFVDMLTGRRHERGCYLDAFVRNVRAKASFPLTLPEDYTLCRVLTFDSDERLSALEGASVTLFDGWTEDVLLTEKRVCLVPEGAVPDGTATLTVQQEGVEPVEMTIIGTVRGGPAQVLYCPFYMRWDDAISYSYAVESCSFSIGDNARLDETKAEIYEYFVEPSLSNEKDGLHYGVLVQDETYLSTMEEMQANLTMLRLLRPVLIVLTCCIGFFAGYLSIRGRTKEFAVMRCLGLKRRRVFGLVFEELLLLTLLGGLTGFAAGFLLEGALTWEAVRNAALVTGAFLLGSSAAAIHVTGVNVMKLMKAED